MSPQEYRNDKQTKPPEWNLQQVKLQTITKKVLQGMPCTYNVHTQVRCANIVAVKKQYVVHILSMWL